MKMSSKSRPFSTMSREELAEVSRKGGVASGEARRAKRAEIEAAKIMLAAKLELAADTSIPMAERWPLICETMQLRYNLMTAKQKRELARGMKAWAARDAKKRR
jgi:hypothetical protein